MWRSSWPFGWDKSDPTQAETWYEDALMEQIRTKGHYKGIRPLRLKSNPDNDLDVQPAAHGKDAVNEDPALALADAVARRECKEYEQMVNRLKEPIFLLHPGLFDAYGNSNQFSAIVAQHAIRPIMEMMAIRQGMLTLTKLPNGTLVSPGADIPPIDITTVETFTCEPLRRRACPAGDLRKHRPPSIVCGARVRPALVRRQHSAFQLLPDINSTAKAHNHIAIAYRLMTSYPDGKIDNSSSTGGIVPRDFPA